MPRDSFSQDRWNRIGVALVAMSLAALSVSLGHEDTRLEEAQKAVEAFRAAHKRLYDNAAHLKDDTVYRAVLEDVAAIAKGGKKED